MNELREMENFIITTTIIITIPTIIIIIITTLRARAETYDTAYL